MPRVDEDTAGAATVELTIPFESGGILTSGPLHGCFVKKDANLKNFVKKNIVSSADRNKFKRSKYLFYSPSSNFQGEVTKAIKAIISYEKISKNRFSNMHVQKTKTCTVEDPLVIAFDGHFFLCCDSEDLNKSTFLEEYSREVRINQTLDPSKSFYGLGMDCYNLTCISFNMSKCQSQSNNIYNVNEEAVYRKLEEAGPLLKDNKTIVGCYRKSGNCRIEVKMFGKIQGDPQPDRSPPNSQESERVTESLHPTLQNETEHQSPNHLALQEKIKVLNLKDLIEREQSCIEILKNYLRWKHYEQIADRLHVPLPIKAKLKYIISHSPTLDLLHLPKVSNLSVVELVGILRRMSRNDVANKIEKRIPEYKRENLSVKEALNMYKELFEDVGSILDGAKTNNWKTLGRELGFQSDELNQIENNPAKRLLEDHVYPTMDAEQLTVGRFKQLTKVVERPSIMDLFEDYGITERDNSRSIKEVIPSGSERMWKLCLKLNKEDGSGLPKWKHLARCWGISDEISSQFAEPNQKKSPIEILLKDWLIVERPEFTVNELCHILGEIGCNEGKEFLERKLQEWHN